DGMTWEFYNLWCDEKLDRLIVCLGAYPQKLHLKKWWAISLLSGQFIATGERNFSIAPGAISPNGNRVFMRTDDQNTLGIGDTNDPLESFWVVPAGNFDEGVPTFSPNNVMIAAQTARKTTIILDSRTGETVREFEGLGSSGAQYVWSRDSRFLFAGSRTGDVRR